MAIAVVAIVAGLAIGFHIAWFYYRSNTQGSSLVHREQRAITSSHPTAGSRLSSASCRPFDNLSTAPQGILTASSIGMTAPVVAGTDDPQLNVAVGHLSTSVWPGTGGTVVLAAHDVTYFSRINQLHSGQLVDFVTPCHTYVYRVTSSQIVSAGSPIYSYSNRFQLVLETCYPLNALFITNQRFLVSASEVAILPTGGRVPASLPSSQAPSVPAPPVLVSQGLSLTNNEAPLGVLQYLGQPSSSWQQSVAPLNDEAAILADYFAAVRSAEQNQSTWWGQLTNGVPMSAAGPLVNSSISYDSYYPQQLNPTLIINGGTLTGAAIDTAVAVGGERYTLHVAMTIDEGNLVITQWTMTPQ